MGRRLPDRCRQSPGIKPPGPPSGITIEGDPADWLITRLVGNFEHTTPPGAVCPLGSIRSPLEVLETGAFYRRDGVGFLFAPVGEPIAYLKSRVTYAGKGRVSLDIAVEMSGVQVDPGETRWGQQAILLMEKPQCRPCTPGRLGGEPITRAPTRGPCTAGAVGI